MTDRKKGKIKYDITIIDKQFSVGLAFVTLGVLMMTSSLTTITTTTH
jgi:hypothetical protein